METMLLTASQSTMLQTCKACGSSGKGNYCCNCGQSYHVKRITVGALWHEVFHLFTHLDKGFGYTLKRLFLAPGEMPREYIAGERHRHQKPFSMFFICITVAALAMYWINLALIRFYGAGESGEAEFFHQYMVFLQIVLVPVYTLVTYLFFYDSKYNYAEIGVLILYNFSVFILLVAFCNLLKFIWPLLNTRYIELPAIVLYNVVSLVRFFSDKPKAGVALRAILSVSVCFWVASLLQDLIVKLFFEH